VRAHYEVLKSTIGRAARALSARSVYGTAFREIVPALIGRFAVNDLRVTTACRPVIARVALRQS
jgi:hypothetical protein